MLTRAHVLSGAYDAFYHGQRMRLLPCDSPLADHERDDTGGILYGKDGSRTSYWYPCCRQSSPDWQPFRLPQALLVDTGGD